jgi:hypothetical protein
MQDPLCQIDKNLLQRTAGPYNLLKITRRATFEHCIPAARLQGWLGV